MKSSERNEIVVVDKNVGVRTEDYNFPFKRKSLIYGSAAGVSMVIVSLLIAMVTGNEQPGWDYLKYIFLGVALGMVLNNYKSYLPEGKVFKDGMVLGLYTSVIAAIVMVMLNFVINLLGIETTFAGKFGIEADSFGSILTILGLLAIECIGYGLILTFAWLQLLKDPKPAE